MNATVALPHLMNTSQLPKLLLAAAPCCCTLHAAVQTHANALCCLVLIPVSHSSQCNKCWATLLLDHANT